MVPNYLELLYQAIAAKLGVVVETDAVELLRQKLYAARTASLDPALDNLSFIISPTNPQSELWIVKKVPDAPQG